VALRSSYQLCADRDHGRRPSVQDCRRFVVPSSSSLADRKQLWDRRPWNQTNTTVEMNGHKQAPPQPPSSSQEEQGCIRKERPIADFRGTSMYASLRVHQSKDYGRRDDIWGLLYVFCDLVSGGLPWMKQAGERDREMCKRMKEMVHGESGNSNGDTDQIRDLLKGAAHHVSKQRSQLGGGSVAPPLKLSADEHKVQLLRTAYQHVSRLQFHDEPDYDLIETCLRGLTKHYNPDLQEEDDQIPPIDWNMPNRADKHKRKRSSSGDVDNHDAEIDLAAVTAEIVQHSWPSHVEDCISHSLLEEAEQDRQQMQLSSSQKPPPSSSNSSSTPL